MPSRCRRSPDTPCTPRTEPARLRESWRGSAKTIDVASHFRDEFGRDRAGCEIDEGLELPNGAGIIPYSLEIAAERVVCRRVLRVDLDGFLEVAPRARRIADRFIFGGDARL